MNNGLPKVSVIIPCYNCEKWIVKCIDSIVNQDYKGQIEIVCVDDCSQDNTVQIIKNYKNSGHSNITILENKENMGPGNSRNIGIQHSTGQWIAFCDSDDWYDEDFVSSMVYNALENDSDIVMCNYKKVLESNGSVITVDYLKNISDNYTNEDCIIYSKASLCLLLVKRYIFRNVKIPDLRNGEDIAIVPVLEAKAKKITYIEKAPYNYFIRKNSVSNKTTDKVFYSLCDAYAYINDNLNDKYKLEKEYLGIRTLLYGAVMNGFKANIPVCEIKKEIKKFVLLYPRWYKNPYIKNITLSKRVFLLMVRMKCYILCKALARIHGKISV